MRRIAFYLILISCLSIFSHGAFGQVRERASFNGGWLFQKDDPAGTKGNLAYNKIEDWIRASGNEFIAPALKTPLPTGNPGEGVVYTGKTFDDTAWRKLDLPHDWAIEGDFRQALSGETGKRPFEGVGWYRKHFVVSPKDEGRQVYIDFDGAMAYPAVWVNSKFVGGWAYGYTSFRVDITPYLEFGKENVLAVRLENPPESSRWYPGSGIYRNVWLVKTASVHVGQWGMQITTPEISKDSAGVNVKVTIENDSESSAAIVVKTSIYKSTAGRPAKKPVAFSTAKRTSIPAEGRQIVETSVIVPHPSLWNLATPQLYTAVTSITQNGKLVDTYETNFGIRSIKFDPARGLLLNGESVEIKGICLHHDLGALGAAVNVRALERQIEIMKEMGANAIRTSHNPPAPELLDLADRIGVLIMDEAFDAWETQKKDNDYHRIFADWHEKDLRAMIRRDRNHPSIILWSIGNEIPDQKKPRGPEIARELTRIVHEEDTTRPVTAASDVVESGYNDFGKALDVFGYNYKPQEYVRFREKNPLKPLIGSETVSAISSRGEYFFPAPDTQEKGNVMVDFHVTSYDFQTPSWVKEFEGQEKTPAVAGEFVWTGFDYLGEPAPYSEALYWLLELSDPAVRAIKEKEYKETGRVSVPSRSSYFGIVDTCGFPKDRYYAYLARWRPELPTAHIFPHWDWPERIGKVTPVGVYTSGDEGELFLNGKSMGRKRMEQYQYRIYWKDVVYEPGELRVVAYKNGKKWAEDVVKTSGDAKQIQMTADRAAIRADGQDLSFITVRITDKDGLMVARAHDRIKFTISGAGEIVAIDNGDPTDLESFQSTNRRAFNGMALVIVRGIKNLKGPVEIRAEAPGLTTAVYRIKSSN